MVLPMPGWTAFTKDADASAWCAKYCDEATTVYTIAAGVEAAVEIGAGRWALAPGDIPDDGVFASVAEITDADLRAGYTAVAAAPTITLLDGEIVTDQHGTPLRRRDSVAHHADLVEVHTPYIASTTAPTSTSLGYPLQVGMVWRDTSGGIGVLRSCTAVDGAGVGTWGMDGPAVVKLPLADADTAGGVLAWQNPESAAVVSWAVRFRFTAVPPARPEFAVGSYNNLRLDVVDALADPRTDDTQHGGTDTTATGLHDATSAAIIAAAGWLLVSAIPLAPLASLALEPSAIDTAAEWEAATGFTTDVGQTYRNTLDGQLYVAAAYDSGTGAIDWDPIDDPSVAGLAGYAYVYYHLA